MSLISKYQFSGSKISNLDLINVSEVILTNLPNISTAVGVQILQEDNSNVILAVYQTIEGTKLYKTLDKGANWVQIEEGISSLIIDVTTSEFQTAIDNSTLIPGMSYCITDYTTTTAQADTTSAGHDFDIVVTALSTNELSENAKCVRKSDDTYFTNANLEAWEIKYCIDNDTSRFAWADTENGKGVIYYMKDEWGNECPYDFKNIQYLKNDVWVYTFGGTTDDSLTGGCYHNTMMDYVSSSILTLNSITFGNSCHSNTFGNDCYSNTFGDWCESNTFNDYCYSNTFGDGCGSNTFDNYCNSNTFGRGSNNAFGNGCSNNTFGDGCHSNTFGNDCYSNTFGDECSSNTFGYDCGSNTFGSNCYSNTFGSSCSNNTFGNGCSNNTFGDSCYFNTFGNSCYSNTFGNSCGYNNFYHGISGTTKKDYIRFIVLEDGCRYNNFYSPLTTSYLSYLQRIRIKGLENTTPTNTQITLSAVNTKYEWVIAKNSLEVIKQYCPDDLVP